MTAGHQRWRAPLAACCAALALFASCGDDRAEEVPPQQRPSPTTPSPAPSRDDAPPTTEPGDATRLARDAAMRFIDTYVDSHGRVIRHDEGGDTVSEGQAYAMLMAAAIGDRDTFSLVWGWTKDHMMRPDGLLAWHWKDGVVTDDESAPDADLDAAHALLLAAAAFDEPGHHDDAMALADAIYEHLTVELDGGRLLVAGPWGLADMSLNPSYFSPMAFSILFREGDDVRWGEVAGTSRSIIDDLTREPPHLPPDWASLIGSDAVPRGEPPRYGFDAVRTPWRLALDCDPAGQRLAARAWPFLSQVTAHGTTPPVTVYGLDGTPHSEDGHPAATVGAAASAAAAGDTDAAQRLLMVAEDQDRAQPSYYGSALVALGRLGLETDLLGRCP
jgi:endoglucanase